MRSILAALCLVLFASTTEARNYYDRHDVRGYHWGGGSWRYWDDGRSYRKSRIAKRKAKRARLAKARARAAARQARIAARLSPPIAETPAAKVATTFDILQRYADYVLPKGNVSLNGVLPVLATKVRQLASMCGARAISAVRHTYVAGTRRISLHASGRAVDMVGNRKCIYPLLENWPGGYSTDYARVNHVHISYGGREHGARFAHGGERKYRSSRNAKRHKYRHRYARA